MTVVVDSDLGWFVDHQLSIDETYKCTEVTWSKDERAVEEEMALVQQQIEMTKSKKEPDLISFKCKPDLFAIWQPFVMDSHFNGKTKEADTDSFSVLERIETSVEKESSTLPSTACHVCHKKTSEKVPAVLLASSIVSHDELHIPVNVQQKTGTNCCIKKRKRRKLPLNVGELASLDEHLKISQLLSTALHQLRNVLIDTGYDAAVAVYDNNISARHAAASAGDGGIGDLLVQCCQQAASLSIQSNELMETKNIDCLRPDEDLCNKLIEQQHQKSVTQTLMGFRFILPPHSRFLLSDISRLEPLLIDEIRYDCIVIDPPWENKSVKRKKTYATLADWDFLQLPVRQLCGRATLVVVWVTNKQRQQNFVREHLFPSWNIKYLTKWYWLKVTKLLKPVYALNTMGPSKRPYECILLGSTSSSGNTFEKISQNRVIVSVPCSIHSRKPPLNEILQSYLPANAKCLEMFARSLLPNWTSWGNEVLAYQHLDCFESHPYDTSTAEEGSSV